MEITKEQLLQMIGAKQATIELNLQPRLTQALVELNEARSATCPLKHCECSHGESDPALD